MRTKKELLENAVAPEEVEIVDNTDDVVVDEVQITAEDKMKQFFDEYVKALHQAANVVYYMNMVTNGKVKTACSVFAKDLYKYIKDRRDDFKAHYDRVSSGEQQLVENSDTTVS